VQIDRAARGGDHPVDGNLEIISSRRHCYSLQINRCRRLSGNDVDSVNDASAKMNSI
jgi:hypothetical protein